MVLKSPMAIYQSCNLNRYYMFKKASFHEILSLIVPTVGRRGSANDLSLSLWAQDWIRSRKGCLTSCSLQLLNCPRHESSDTRHHTIWNRTLTDRGLSGPDSVVDPRR